MSKLYIVGAGGLGRELLDLALACGNEVVGFLDESKTGTSCRDLLVSHPDEAALEIPFVIGIADTDARRRLAVQLRSRGQQTTRLVHPTATIGPHTAIGPGSVVLAQSCISSSVRIEQHCLIYYTAVLGHDVVIEDYTNVYPSANVSGDVYLESQVTVASSAFIMQGTRIGRRSVVGAGAVALRDVPSEVVVAGNPAKVIGRSRKAGASQL